MSSSLFFIVKADLTLPLFEVLMARTRKDNVDVREA